MEHSGRELWMLQTISISCVLQVMARVTETSALRASLKLTLTLFLTHKRSTALSSSTFETPGADRNGQGSGPTRTRRTGRLRDNSWFEILKHDEASTLSKSTRTMERSGWQWTTSFRSSQVYRSWEYLTSGTQSARCVPGTTFTLEAVSTTKTPSITILSSCWLSLMRHHWSCTCNRRITEETTREAIILPWDSQSLKIKVNQYWKTQSYHKIWFIKDQELTLSKEI